MKLEKKELNKINDAIKTIENGKECADINILDVSCHVSKSEYKDDFYNIACYFRYTTRIDYKSDIHISKLETELISMVKEKLNDFNYCMNSYAVMKNEANMEFDNIIFNKCPFTISCRTGTPCLDCIHYHFLKNDLTEVEITDFEGLKMLKESKAVIFKGQDIDVIYNIKTYIKKEYGDDFKNTIYKISGKTINEYCNIDDDKAMYTNDKIFTCIIPYTQSDGSTIRSMVDVHLNSNSYYIDDILLNAERLTFIY